MTALRRAALVCAIAVAFALGAVQVCSMSFYGDLAQPPALPALIPAAWGVAVGDRLEPLHLPAPVRVAYARALLHRGRTADAAAIVTGLPPGLDAADLRGQLAERAGQPLAALDAYALAGDFERAQRLIDVVVGSGRLDDAARLESELAAALGGNGQAAVRARSLWRLGQILATRAAAESRSVSLEHRSLDAYEQALALAPNEETYLLAAGREALELGEREVAVRYYERALEAVPDSSDARAGLAEARR